MKSKDVKTKNLITFDFIGTDKQTALLQDVTEICNLIRRMKQRLSDSELDGLADGFSRIGSKLISRAMITFAKGGDLDDFMPLLKEVTKDSPFLTRVVHTINVNLS